MASAARPLEGVLVVAVEQAVAAPFCTSRLADAGARVIKIERAEGDFARAYDDVANGQSSYFVWLNRGKESAVLDLASAQGHAVMKGLLQRADVLVQNLKPGSLAKLGFEIERLRREFPRLICCSISGYSEFGPLANRKAYDLLIQAETGLASVTGSPEHPIRVGISIVDIAAGVTAQASILNALLAREKSGQGCDIRISMFDVMADWLTVPLLHTDAGRPPKQAGFAHPSIAPYGVFRAKDGKEILIAVQNEREWRSLCADVLRRPEMASDERFASNAERVRNRSETDDAVAAAVGGMERRELLDRLEQADIAFAEVNDMHGLAAHPHLRRTPIATPAGPVHYPAPAAVVDGEAWFAPAVPALGADTDRIIAEFSVPPKTRQHVE